MNWNWRVDPAPGSPEQNMAIDAGLLADLAEGRSTLPTVRVYGWDEPAVSIGRLQSEAPVRERYPALPLVRRPTGGRAVLHGSDLTISVAVRLDRLPPLNRSVSASHEAIMDCVQAALRAVGLDVCYGGCSIGSRQNAVNCFDLSASCDLIDSRTGTKLVGSAQRREKDALLQQMSLQGMIFDRLHFLSHLHDEFRQMFTQATIIDSNN